MNTSTDNTPRLVDRFGREIKYLRISVTDRCNLRCLYCIPCDGIAKLSHGDILTYEEILRLA
ncbi:MAG: GTP 3',8-cyclase MoaA, partial [Gammaproteobacteria bacterium]|nr:GTP 3',8-cyclase MoaA [Gammaproteobacteria bacterium]